MICAVWDGDHLCSALLCTAREGTLRPTAARGGVAPVPRAHRCPCGGTGHTAALTEGPGTSLPLWRDRAHRCPCGGTGHTAALTAGSGTPLPLWRDRGTQSQRQSADLPIMCSAPTGSAGIWEPDCSAGHIPVSSSLSSRRPLTLNYLRKPGP